MTLFKWIVFKGSIIFRSLVAGLDRDGVQEVLDHACFGWRCHHRLSLGFEARVECLVLALTVICGWVASTGTIWRLGGADLLLLVGACSSMILLLIICVLTLVLGNLSCRALSGGKLLSLHAQLNGHLLVELGSFLEFPLLQIIVRLLDSLFPVNVLSLAICWDWLNNLWLMDHLLSLLVWLDVLVWIFLNVWLRILLLLNSLSWLLLLLLISLGLIEFFVSALSYSASRLSRASLFSCLGCASSSIFTPFSCIWRMNCLLSMNPGFLKLHLGQIFIDWADLFGWEFLTVVRILPSVRWSLGRWSLLDISSFFVFVLNIDLTVVVLDPLFKHVHKLVMNHANLPVCDAEGTSIDQAFDSRKLVQNNKVTVLDLEVDWVEVLL